MKFRLEKLSSKKIKVSRTTMFAGYYQEIDTNEADIITEWVTQCQIGRRIAWDQWQLNNDDAVTMFLLKWSV